jgi:hypothetical protein
MLAYVTGLRKRELSRTQETFAYDQEGWHDCPVWGPLLGRLRCTGAAFSAALGGIPCQRVAQPRRARVVIHQ